MKKWLLIPLIIVTIVIAFSCSSTIRTANTSLVTISVGSNQTASIKAEPATLMTKVRLFFAKTIRVPSAVAAVPSVVLSIRLTVSAPDMPTVTIIEPVLGQEVVIITIEIPNGNGRVFLVEGLNSSAAVSYWGEFTANLAGGSFSQAVDMLFVGSALSYLYVDISGSDLDTGTRSSPFRTITRALAEAAITKGNVAIFIEPGTYVTGETFPIRLQSNTALVCLGDKYTTVIDKGAIAPTIAGAPGAVVNGCRINSVPAGSATIDDTASAMTIINSYVFGDPASPGNSPQVCISLSANSRVAKSTITGCSFNVSGIGINITAGSPTIELNTITANQGTGVVVSGGTPVIQNNQITANAGAPGTGIAVSGGIPIIQGNDIRTNTTGISIANVSPTVTNNTIHNNGTGISVSTSTAFPVINSNSIYCNSTVDMSGSGTISFDATLNSWDHDATTTPTGTPPGPTTGVAACPAGTDICSGTLPLYIPFNPAVPGGCLL